MIWSDTQGLRATKYIYISDDHLTGHQNNIGTLTILGQQVNNTNAVLTAVFGV